MLIPKICAPSFQVSLNSTDKNTSTMNSFNASEVNPKKGFKKFFSELFKICVQTIFDASTHILVRRHEGDDWHFSNGKAEIMTH